MPIQVRLKGQMGAWKASLTRRKLSPGLEEVRLKLKSPRPAPPPKITLSFDWPSLDTQALWHPAAYLNKELPVDWWPAKFTSSAVQWAPVMAFHSLSGENRLCFAFSDAMNPVDLRAGVVEETAEAACHLELFKAPHPPIREYSASLRLDTRKVSYQKALSDVSTWWAAQPGYEPARVPGAARQPMYSTWTSFHQNITEAAIEEQCRRAIQLGCGAVIVDDGWQTADGGRGYTYCGDWEVSPKRIKDMKAHVRRVQAMGLKYLLWYSVPFVGAGSRAFARFKAKFLSYSEGPGGFDRRGVLDPRFPEVREYLIGIYERALRDWNLDGFKLDFVDCFTGGELKGGKLGGRDMASLPEAADRLLSDVMARLRALKPDIMIEFRQAYIGPLMRKYGNMFRAADCPNNLLQNHVRVLDLRQLCGGTAAHSDMLLWHAKDKVESAALQLLAVLFSVPQISVLLDKIPSSHLEMLKFWLGFWRRHSKVLLDGVLELPHPERQYPVVRATAGDTRIVSLHGQDTAPAGRRPPRRLQVVNARREAGLWLELESSFGRARLEIFDCRGRRVEARGAAFGRGLHRLKVPPAGLASLSR